MSAAGHLFAGLETRVDPNAYFWDGERRGGDPAHRYVVVQYTLRGWGIYEGVDGGRSVGVGEAFFAVVPSMHRYYLPAESESTAPSLKGRELTPLPHPLSPRGKGGLKSPGWTFFFVIVRHPYAVGRIAASVGLAEAVHRLAVDGPLLPRLVRLFESTYSGFRDEFEEEEASIELAIEFDRHVRNTLYPQPPRERLLERVRSMATGEVDVSTLAAEFGMTRSGFSHHFKAVTGLAPASFVRQARLERAAQLLIRTDRKLEAVAEESGFGSANDLCKVFRKHYHQSPTSFRRQMSPRG